METALHGSLATQGRSTRPGPPPRALFRWLPLLFVLVLVGIVALVKAKQIATLVGAGKAAEAAGPPPETVGSDVARDARWTSTLRAIGTVQASRGVTLTSEEPGTVRAIRFTSGSRVREGDLLVELDTSVERAQLASIVARRDLARSNARRSRALGSASVVAPADVDGAEATLRSASADASALGAQIARKTVRAPFDGVVGIRRVNVGQFLSPGTALVDLQSTEEPYVDFTVPQQLLGEVHVGSRVELSMGDAKLRGRVTAIEPSVDEATRQARIRATADDPRSALRPGMFVDVDVILPSDEAVVVVPSTALVHAAYGDSVFVIEPSSRGDGLVAQQRFVRTGDVRGDFVAVRQGIASGERVVVAGAFKLRNGSPVNVNDDVALHPRVDPHPDNR